MGRHSEHIRAFVKALYADKAISREEMGRQLLEAIDALEELLANFPHPRGEGLRGDDN